MRNSPISLGQRVRLAQVESALHKDWNRSQDRPGGEVAVEVLGVVDVGLPADGAHHVPYVLVPHRDGEVLLEAIAANRALTGGQRLHLSKERGPGLLGLSSGKPDTPICGRSSCPGGGGFSWRPRMQYFVVLPDRRGHSADLIEHVGELRRQPIASWISLCPSSFISLCLFQSGSSVSGTCGLIGGEGASLTGDGGRCVPVSGEVSHERGGAYRRGRRPGGQAGALTHLTQNTAARVHHCAALTLPL
ncbi:hypothetical protein JZ751_015552 [Albula glossodonta]|uniref:Uncharacterized protein n=1 Tax=Albula glossodonta TaxID=121402 RepID=A0A8T2MV05_9TELE|nr:hypothetical protein JZ751_015552 [Albula glossodonta]